MTEHIALYCRDWGRGISKEHINTIFTPFITTKAKGTGLGLATTEKIASEHEGMIEVYSREGIGTIFIVRLPATKDTNNLLPSQS